MCNETNFVINITHLLELEIWHGGGLLNQKGDRPINKYVMVEYLGIYICCAAVVHIHKKAHALIFECTIHLNHGMSDKFSFCH